MQNHSSEFNDVIGSLLGDAPKPEPTIGETVRFVPSTPVTTTPVEKPKAERKIRAVDEGKIDVTEHSPRFLKSAHIYSKGYVRLQWPQQWNAVSLYRRQLVELIQWARSDEAMAFLASLDATGKIQD